MEWCSLLNCERTFCILFFLFHSRPSGGWGLLTIYSFSVSVLVVCVNVYTSSQQQQSTFRRKCRKVSDKRSWVTIAASDCLVNQLNLLLLLCCCCCCCCSCSRSLYWYLLLLLATTSLMLEWPSAIQSTLLQVWSSCICDLQCICIVSN